MRSRTVLTSRGGNGSGDADGADGADGAEDDAAGGGAAIASAATLHLHSSSIGSGSEDGEYRYLSKSSIGVDGIEGVDDSDAFAEVMSAAAQLRIGSSEMSAILVVMIFKQIFIQC